MSSLQESGPIRREEAAPAGANAILRAALSSIPAWLAAVVMMCVVAMAVFAPLIATANPTAIAPAERLLGPTSAHFLGTDALGRDTFSRIVYGSRLSLTVGAGVTVFSVALGLVVGVFAGYFRAFDMVIMRVMDGLMAIPGILLAIALIALTGASLATVLVAITVPEVPRVVRLVRGVILSVRSEDFVEAAITLGSPIRRILWRHLIPSTVAPLTVQATFVFASAVLTESTLSFLGAGLPSEIPSWGNMMADGRMYFQLKPGLIFFPGFALAMTLLSVNIIGDVLRDRLDPKMEKRA
ncbi:ABC transporter permease [Mesorhizobium sp. CGMCC 1.15528]|uniref:ABC transporter permease n=1 Tax=Mesorhizobium zhangyense TaxID=1776730 RepID=A0A7C9RE65_9HYPH|nr:ABC transporter permease [Mesorhizobium zhangyense]NGN44473.1 ABC transporter permease [Mesorhizobium zhangyense]